MYIASYMLYFCLVNDCRDKDDFQKQGSSVSRPERPMVRVLLCRNTENPIVVMTNYIKYIVKGWWCQN